MLNEWREKIELFWLRRVRMPLSVRHICGKKRITCDDDELVVVSLVKNAEVYINSFIDHYLSLGARHIFILDNGSTDKTVELASNVSGVSVFRCLLPFREYNLLMRQYLVRRFGSKNRWILCVDIDELFDYPCSDRVSLQILLAYLNSRKFTTMVAYMLDMFSGLPLSRLEPGGDNLKMNYPYYDISSVIKTEYPESYPDHGYSNTLQRQSKLHNIPANSAVRHYTGGIRASRFNMPGVYLTKHPLVYINGKTELVHQHFVNHARVADITGLLFHYKFVTGFKARVLDALANKQYWNDSCEYLNYLRELESNVDICLKKDSARKLNSVNELIETDYIQVSKDYMRWCDKYGKNPFKADMYDQPDLKTLRYKNFAGFIN